MNPRACYGRVAVVAAGCSFAALVPIGAHARLSPSVPARAKPLLVRRPVIVDRLIPFGARRRAEMAAYSKRHYGRREWRLRRPRVIVEHYTGTHTFRATYDIFRRDHRDTELHELPNVCAHFVIDRGGTIYWLVPITIRCRHTVGLNYTAIGIEHVGTSDRQVMHDRRQLRASLALTQWLRCTNHIRIRDVIGHNESLRSPFHHERVRALRRQTHPDMRRATMVRYRARLRTRRCARSGGTG